MNRIRKHHRGTWHTSSSHDPRAEVRSHAPAAKVGGRQFRRLIERLHREHGGDNCHGCGRAYRDQEIVQVGYDSRRELLEVGECCRARLAAVIAGSIYFAAGSDVATQLSRLRPQGGQIRNRAGTPWSEDDRAWFAAHPGRSHRLRRAFPGEWPPDAEASDYTVVRQGAPGARLRLPITLVEFPPPEDEPPEAAAWAIWDLTCEAQERGERTVATDKIYERCALLETSGGTGRQ